MNRLLNLKNNLDASSVGFTLVEILIVVSVLLVLLSSGVAVLSSRTTQASLDATAREVVELISQARNYSVTGYFGDAWGIKVLNNNSACVASGDCVVMFKGEAYAARDIAYDRNVQLNQGVYIDPSAANEFYFTSVAGWLSTSTGALAEQGIILKNNIGEQLVVTTTPVGLVYYGN